jgi:hypothetical protein
MLSRFLCINNFKTELAMRRTLKLIGLAIGLTAVGCTTKPLNNGYEKQKPTYRVQVGTNKGGIVDNTDLTAIGNIPVDAYSGATSKGLNVSGKVIVPLKRNAVETGLDCMHNGQSFTYNDGANGFVGERKLGVNQLMIPITYSIGLFRSKHPEGLLQIKVGYAAQLNIISVSDGNGSLPNYSTKPFSNGATLGFSTIPVRLKNGAKLGFYIDGYRGTQAYEDFYNRTEFEMPGTAFIKYGIIYQF